MCALDLCKSGWKSSLERRINRLINELISQSSMGQKINKPFPKQALVFTCLQYKSFENPVGKGEIARNEQFLLFPQCFLPI